MFADKPYPTLITPRIEGLGLVDWATENRELVLHLFEEKRALLFRDFDLAGIPGFTRVVDVLSDGPRLPYVDRSTPREEYGSNVYCTTIYPPENTIRLHNEGSYWCVHPQKAFFCCVTRPETGGATPVGDVHAVHERIDPEIRREFAARKWMLQRTYNTGLSLPWQDVFQTSVRAEVEAYCVANRIDFEWGPEDWLRTRQVREPILAHPRTGEPLWHNHAAFFHITTRDAAVRDALRRQLDDAHLPYNTYYGDGGEIDPEVVAHINAAYDAETLRFPWQEGDLHFVDNLRLAHARDPFTGERLILVALTEPYAP
jgi:alpha-ketoglutarate-dependent taurine dioxygenase